MNETQRCKMWNKAPGKRKQNHHPKRKTPTDQQNQTPATPFHLVCKKRIPLTRPKGKGALKQPPPRKLQQSQLPRLTATAPRSRGIAARRPGGRGGGQRPSAPSPAGSPPPPRGAGPPPARPRGSAAPSRTCTRSALAWPGNDGRPSQARGDDLHAAA